MGNRWRKWLVAVAVVASSAIAAENASAQGSVSLQVFYDELQPYGTWVDHGRYGYVWMPNEGADFVPYGSNGYWVQTGYGNTWVSNYSWGWAPFHYGRWFHDDFYGWLWLPDTTWGPAWVTWRSGGGYYGWAPLMPGLSVSMNAGYYNSIPNHYWNFVPYRYVMYRQVYRHCVPRPRVVNVIHNTTVIVNNNYYRNDGPSGGRDRSDNRDRGAYFTGPSRSEIEKRNGERIPVYDVHDKNNPGQAEVSRNSVRLYKPTVEQTTRTRALPAQYTRDNEQGRDKISEIRSRQLRERASGESFDDNRNAIRTNEDAATNRSSMDRMLRDNDGADRAPRDIDDLRRGTPSPSAPAQRSIDRSADNNRRENLDRLGRDTEFNRMKEQKESDQLRRQQSDVQRRQQLQRDEQLQRFKEQQQEQQRFDEQNRRKQDQLQQPNRSNQRESNDQEMRRQQPAQRPSNRQEQLQQPRQRQYEAPRQSPTRQPGQSQQRTSPPARQQQFERSQQSPSSDRRVSTPGRSGASQQMQRQGGTTSSSPQRSRD
jgi:hypothetical protein